MPIRYVARHGALQGKTNACALLFHDENRGQKSFSSSYSSQLSHGKHLLFAQVNENGNIAIYGRNGVEVYLDDPTNRTKFLLFASCGRYLVSVTTCGSITSWSITDGIPELVGHVPECLWPDDMQVSCTAASENFLFLGTETGSVYVSPVCYFPPTLTLTVHCKSPSGYYVSVGRAAPELVGTCDENGRVSCIAPEPKFGQTVLICYRHLVVLWDWEKIRRINAWSVPEHKSCGQVVAVAWKDDGSHFAVGLSSGIYAVACVSVGESKRGQALIFHPRLIGLRERQEVDFSSIADSHTPVLAVEWLDTSLLVAGGCPLGIDGEEFEGGITTIDGLVCDECNKGNVRRTSWKGEPPESHQCFKDDTIIFTSFSPLWQPGDDVKWMKVTPLGYIWVLVNSVVERTSISSSLIPHGSQYDRQSRLLVCGNTSTLLSESKGFDSDWLSSNPSFVTLPHLFAFAEVTAACDIGLLPSLDSQNMTIGLGSSVNGILRGGLLSWSKSIPPEHRDEALSLTQVLILGHADGTLTLWDASGSDPLDTENIYGGIPYQQPSLVLLGALKSNQMTDHAHGNGYVTTLNVLDCSVGQECSHGRRCYVAVGFSSGTVSVIRLGRQSGERVSSSPEVTKVTYVPTSIESQVNDDLFQSSENNCEDSPILKSSTDDISAQIEQAKAMAARISVGDCLSFSGWSNSFSSTRHTPSRASQEATFKPISDTVLLTLSTAVQLILRLHSAPITSLDLCWDPCTMSPDSPILATVDAVGVVSISHGATKEVIIPSCKVPMRPPRSFCIKFGPYPPTLRKQHDSINGNDMEPYSLAVYLLVDDLLSLYNPMTGILLLSLDLRLRNFDPLDHSLGCFDPSWLIFTTSQGLPLKNQRGGRWTTPDVSSSSSNTPLFVY